MASNDMVSTVMYWIIWDLADCDLEESWKSEEVSVGFIPVDLERIPVKGAAETINIESYRGYAANLFPRFCQVGTNLLRSRSQISSHPQIPMEIWNDSLAFYEV